VVLLKFFFVRKKTLYWLLGILVAIIVILIVYNIM